MIQLGWQNWIGMVKKEALKLDEANFPKFEKGKYKNPTIKDLLGEDPVKKVPQNEFELIQAGLTMRKKMADLCKSIAGRLGKSVDAEGLRTLERQIEQLSTLFQE